MPHRSLYRGHTQNNKKVQISTLADHWTTTYKVFLNVSKIFSVFLKGFFKQSCFSLYDNQTIILALSSIVQEIVTLSTHDHPTLSCYCHLLLNINWTIHKGNSNTSNITSSLLTKPDSDYPWVIKNNLLSLGWTELVDRRWLK